MVDVESRFAVPAISAGQLVGVIVVKSHDIVAFDEDDQRLLAVVTSILAGSIEVLRTDVPEVHSSAKAFPARTAPPAADDSERIQVRFFDADGSVFVGSEYVIKGVAGRLLWRLLNLHQTSGHVEFTNKELPFDPTLKLPTSTTTSRAALSC